MFLSDTQHHPAYVIHLSVKCIPSANHSVIMAYLLFKLTTYDSIPYFVIWNHFLIIINVIQWYFIVEYVKWNWNWNRLSETIIIMSCCRKTDKTEQISNQQQCWIVTLDGWMSKCDASNEGSMGYLHTFVVCIQSTYVRL